jgi:hypothetical protein
MKESRHDDACLEEFLFEEEEETSFRNKTEAVVMAGQTSLSTVHSTTMAALSATWQAHLLKHFQGKRKKTTVTLIVEKYFSII